MPAQSSPLDPEHALVRAARPDTVLRYGDHAEAIIDIHLPRESEGTVAQGRGLLALFHGGFWKVGYDRIHTRPLAAALAAQGLVVATPEYRRVGGTGDLTGGWPQTFDDVTDAIRSLPGLVEKLDIAPTRTTVLGHSAGGQLALWLANEPHRIHRVIGLAPVADLRHAAAAGLGGGAVPALLGGSPEEVPDRYDATDPATRLTSRPNCDVLVIHGVEDLVVPIENARRLAARHPYVVMRELVGVEHYGVIDPRSGAWPVVRAAVTGEPPDR